ncbi:T3SS effector HopA1 family protein [Kitasatospora sp. NPDC056138]|uniref:T3SS effector HopA1 family protein n=1 Tax=Kitasatospora sp. NPDC056138 TaxID=3345724 RepID=UPI0035D691DB
MTLPATVPVRLPDELTELLDTVAVDLDAAVATVGGRRHQVEGSRTLRGVLRGVLYQSWHAGIEEPEDGTVRRPRPPRAHAGPLERALIRAVPHEHTRIAATLRSVATDGSAVVETGGVRILVHRDALVEADDSSAVVALPAVRPWLSPGFVLAHGSRGGLRRGSEYVRLYVHVRRADAAEEVWRRALESLEDSAVPYQAKILAHASHYPRRDAMVVYLDAAHAGVARDVVEAVRSLTGLGAATSAFAQRLAPGLALASEPADHRVGWTGLSFGQHRAAAVTEGLLAHATDPFAGSRDDQVAAALSAAGIDPTAPYRNLLPTRDPS